MNMQQVIDSEAAAPVRNSRLAGEVATRTLNLALQGGGAHGAFTWGVLDRLLEDDRLSFEGVVATSVIGIDLVSKIVSVVPSKCFSSSS